MKYIITIQHMQEGDPNERTFSRHTEGEDRAAVLVTTIQEFSERYKGETILNVSIQEADATTTA